MFIHQRRAHIRVLYDKYLKLLGEKRGYVQRLLFPERIDLSVAEAAMLESISGELSSLGFDISSLGGCSFSINGAPADVDGLSPVELLHELVRGEVELSTSVKEQLHERLALSMARRVAIVKGQILSNDEINALVGDLFAGNMPARTPDGKTIIHLLSDSDIEKFF
jgi:DNA mismatch repair protein MutL